MANNNSKRKGAWEPPRFVKEALSLQPITKDGEHPQKRYYRCVRGVGLRRRSNCQMTVVWSTHYNTRHNMHPYTHTHTTHPTNHPTKIARALQPAVAQRRL